MESHFPGPLRGENGWRVSPHPQDRRHCYLSMFAPVGCVALMVGRPFSGQQDVLNFLEMIFSLQPRNTASEPRSVFPSLGVWADFPNGWSYKVALSPSIRDAEHRYLLWIKSPATSEIFLGFCKWKRGRETMKVTETLSQKDVERFLDYFRSV